MRQRTYTFFLVFKICTQAKRDPLGLYFISVSLNPQSTAQLKPNIFISKNKSLPTPNLPLTNPLPPLPKSFNSLPNFHFNTLTPPPLTEPLPPLLDALEISPGPYSANRLLADHASVHLHPLRHSRHPLHRFLGTILGNRKGFGADADDGYVL